MKRVLSVLIFLFTYNAWSSPVPVITAITYVGQYTPEFGMNYYFTHSVIDVGPAGDWVPPPYGYVGLGFRYGIRVGSMVGMYKAKNTSSISTQLLDYYYNGYGNVTNMMTSENPPDPSVCFAYFWSPSDAAGRWDGEPWSNVYTPSGCTNVPPATEWCKITTPEIVLDHGSITLRNAEGHSASAQLNVQCANTMAVSFRLVTDDPYVYLDDENNGKAEITVDNKPLKSKIDLPQGNSTLTIKDMLTGVNTEGVHSGSSVLVMMPY